MIEVIESIVFVINVISAFGVVVLVLMQHGKGADMGTGFGSGSAGSLFGSAGSASFLSRSTAFCAIIFFASCFALAVMMAPKQSSTDLSVMASMQPSAAVAQASAADAQKNSSIPD